MVAAALFVASLLLAARAWHAGRGAEPARVTRSLVRLAVGAVAATLSLALAARASGALSNALIVTAGVSALTTFAALTSLAFWGRFPRWTIRVRAPFAAVAIFMAIIHAPWTAVAFVALVSLLSYRWREALDTVGLFRTFLGSVVLLALLLAPFPGGPTEFEGPLAPALHFARMTLFMVRIYAIIGVFKTFTAFARDPSLGIRTVSRRLALSHVLVLIVPLGITLALWVSTTYLGVNADRALAGQRLLQRESAQLAAGLRLARSIPDGGAAALRLARERARRWPGTRLWVARDGVLERVFGDSIPGERELGAWAAGLDTLPDHGVVGLRGRRWLGAAVRDTVDPPGAVLLAPIRDALDSTLAPIMRATFLVREGETVDSAFEDDSLGSIVDSLASLKREADAIRAGASGRRPRVRTSRGANRVAVSGPGTRTSPAVVSVGSERDSLTASQVFGFGGMAILSGPEFGRTRWRRSQFMLTARADLRSTLAGMYENVRENPLQAVPIALLGMIVLLLLPVAWIDFSMVGGMGRSIAQAIGALRDGAAALGRGELAHRIEIRGDDDLWETARQFNRMAEGLERARLLEKERDRIEGELDLARRIQRRLLPDAPPVIAGLEIAGRSEPAREVGGDYYDHFDLGGGRVLLVIADVSGKGVPAALLMSGFRASLMSQDAHVLGPDVLAERINIFLHRSVESGKFVTAFFAFLDAATGRLVYANAGHNPPALRRADGRVEWLAAGGLVLGILPLSRFESGEAVLAPGDLLVLYTDGVTEGADASGELWGDDRLVRSLDRLAGLSCVEAAESLVREVRAFEGDTGPADDITVLVARRA